MNNISEIFFFREIRIRWFTIFVTVLSFAAHRHCFFPSAFGCLLARRVVFGFMAFLFIFHAALRKFTEPTRKREGRRREGDGTRVQMTGRARLKWQVRWCGALHNALVRRVGRKTKGSSRGVAALLWATYLLRDKNKITCSHQPGKNMNERKSER